MGHLEKRRTATQPNMPFARAEIHGDRTVGVQGDFGMIGQGHRAHLPRYRHIIGAEIVEPTPGLEAQADGDAQQQAGGHGQARRPAPARYRLGPVHGREQTLQGHGLLFGQGTRRHFAQFPEHLGPGIGLDMGRVGLHPETETRLVAPARLIVQQAEPGQGGLFLVGCHGDTGRMDHDAFPGRRVTDGAR